MNQRFIELITALVRESYRPYDADPAFAPRHAQRRTEILQEIWRIRKHKPALAFLAEVNCSGWQDELPHTLLARAERIAAEWLPVLIRQQQALETETEMTKFKKQRAAFDPFMDQHVSLTQDSYSGEIPPDDLDYHLDSRGNVVFKGNK